MTVFSEKEQKAGAFNFTESVYREEDLETYREYFPDKIKGKTERITHLFLAVARILGGNACYADSING
jgi:hypothetical protein